MNYNDKINEIRENNEIRSRLRKAGVLPYVVGPTGPRGKGLEIMGNYNSLDDLKREHPTGKNGDTYIVNGDLYIWDEQIAKIGQKIYQYRLATFGNVK